jgi:hypothetical protein
MDPQGEVIAKKNISRLPFARHVLSLKLKSGESENSLMDFLCGRRGR